MGQKWVKMRVGRGGRKWGQNHKKLGPENAKFGTENRKKWVQKSKKMGVGRAGSAGKGGENEKKKNNK
jgi:hypothetical protein